MNIKRFNVNEAGLNRFFGPLESKIMDLLWSFEDGLSIREVQENLSRENPISFNAVMTVMNRLLDKGHLKKSSKGQGRNRYFNYQSVQSKESFLTEQTKAVTYGLIHDYGDLVVSHMIEALEDGDPGLTEKLRDLLNRLDSEEKP